MTTLNPNNIAPAWEQRKAAEQTIRRADLQIEKILRVLGKRA